MEVKLVTTWKGRLCSVYMEWGTFDASMLYWVDRKGEIKFRGGVTTCCGEYSSYRRKEADAFFASFINRAEVEEFKRQCVSIYREQFGEGENTNTEE